MMKYPRVQGIQNMYEDIVRTIGKLIEDRIKSLSITVLGDIRCFISLIGRWNF